MGRSLTLYPQKQYEAQLEARQRQQTEAFKKLYADRAGIESQSLKECDVLGYEPPDTLGWREFISNKQLPLQQSTWHVYSSG